MSIVIKVEDLAKQYRLGEVGRKTLSHDFNRWVHKVRGKEDPYLKVGSENDRTIKSESEYVWALQDINFEVKQGEVLGIIGRNGAGKSTLLKILSKVTSPTKGQIKIKGRIASLLEVGTGFHPDLSGRDNIFLNGSILGMKKKEIQRKFDEIVEFAGIERYIDTPVKRYSSGMYVRLAFAVAAHLEPNILIIDEVLAVGDAEFQKKCLGKMQDVSSREGRTILFVSHNMASVISLCSSAFLMKNGRILTRGNTEEVVKDYSNQFISHSELNIRSRTDRMGNGSFKYINVRFRDENFLRTNILFNGKACFIELVFERNITIEKIRKAHFSVGINDIYDNRILLLSTDLTNQNFDSVPENSNSVFIRIDKFPLKAGLYTLTLNCMINGELADWIKHAVQLIVENGDFFNTGRSLPVNQGYLLTDHSFSFSCNTIV